MKFFIVILFFISCSPISYSKYNSTEVFEGFSKSIIEQVENIDACYGTPPPTDYIIIGTIHLKIEMDLINEQTIRDKIISKCKEHDCDGFIIPTSEDISYENDILDSLIYASRISTGKFSTSNASIYTKPRIGVDKGKLAVWANEKKQIPIVILNYKIFKYVKDSDE